MQPNGPRIALPSLLEVGAFRQHRRTPTTLVVRLSSTFRAVAHGCVLANADGMRLANVVASIAAVAAVLVTIPVRASDPAVATATIESAPAAPQTESPPERWYGWQTLIVDAAAAGAFVAGAGNHIDALSATGMILYGAGPPVVHGLHGRLGPAFEDLALRLVAPVLTALIGVGIEDAMTPDCSDTGDICLRGLAGGLAGLAIGYGAAVAIDAAVLARERETSVPRRETQRATLLLVPLIRTDKTAVTAGIAGRF